MLKVIDAMQVVKKLFQKPMVYGGLIFLVFWVLAHVQDGIYEFVWGDSLVQFLPGIVQNGRELFSGNVPLLDFHHFNGYESFQTGYYGVLYAPTYLAYIIGQYVLQDKFLIMGVLAFFHYVMGIVGFYVLMRRFTEAKFLSFLSALSYVFAAIYINYGTEWWYALIPMAYMPWITYFIIDLLDGVNADKESKHSTWLSALCLGLLLTQVALAGNAQIAFFVYVYEFLFTFVYFNLSGGGIKWKSLSSFVIIVPFVALAVWAVSIFADYAASSTSRAIMPLNNVDYMVGIKLELKEFLKFFLTTDYNHGFNFADDQTFMRHKTLFLAPLGLFNGLGCILFLLSIPLARFFSGIKTVKAQRSILWSMFIIALLGVVMSLGLRFIYEALAQVDALSRMQHVFKHYFQAAFFLSFLGGLFTIKLFEAMRFRWKPFLVGSFVAASFVVLAMNVYYVTDSTVWFFSREPIPLQQNPVVPSQEKFATVGFHEPDIYKPTSELCAQGGGYMCASLFDWHVYGGYEPLLFTGQNDFVNGAANRFDGVYGGINDGLYEIMTWHGYCSLLVKKEAYPDPAVIADILRLSPEHYSVSNMDQRYYFFKNHTCTAADIGSGTVGDIKYHGEGVDVALDGVGEDTKLHLKVFKHDEYRAYDQRGKELEIGEPEHWNTTGIQVPAGTTSIRVRYHAPKLKLLFWVSLLLFPVMLYALGYAFSLWSWIDIRHWSSRFDEWKKRRWARGIAKELEAKGLTIDEFLNPKKGRKRKRKYS